MRPLSVASIVASGCFACMKRLAVACSILAVTLGTLVIVADAQINPYNTGGQTNPYGGAQTNPYGSAQTNPYGGAQTNPYGGAQTNPYGSVQTNPSGSTQTNPYASAQILDAPALPPPNWWPPKKTDGFTVTESYSDIPWTQKLGTYRGNELDEALILPYDALPQANKDYCTSHTLSQERCMIETGINSILTTVRTDTLYDRTLSFTGVIPQDPPKYVPTTLKDYAKRCPELPPGAYLNEACTVTNNKKNMPYCGDPAEPSPTWQTLPCIEVRLELSMYWNRIDPASKQLTLQRRPFGNETNGLYDSGLVITDGTTFAPQMPWYMAHYCPGGQGPVCDDDYFTTINDGFNVNFPREATYKSQNGANHEWPINNGPWSVYPNMFSENTADARPNHCAQYPDSTKKVGSELTTCTLVLGGFDLYPVTADGSTLEYQTENASLLSQFSNALAKFGSKTDISQPDFQRHFPWHGDWSTPATAVTWATVYPQARSNPFLGQYAPTKPDPLPFFRADHFLYPRKCTLADLATTDIDAKNLRQCGLNYEIHYNGWKTQWPPYNGNDTTKTDYQAALKTANMIPNNQYGRTMFLFAGVPGMQLPVSYYKAPSCARCYSVYEQVHNASLFSLYLPIANEADNKAALRNYTDINFYHTLLMTNHMESDPDTFADGIRGRTLWHNEYRSQVMYDPNLNLRDVFPNVMFPAAFNGDGPRPKNPRQPWAPYHDYQCDGCHVRNGSGIPIKMVTIPDPQDPMKTVTYNGLDKALGPYMITESPTAVQPYKAFQQPDYTFTGVIKPMKLVFFDLGRTQSSNNPSTYSDPTNGAILGQAWTNKVMNFYGDSFRVTQPGYSYYWSYGPADANRKVVPTARFNQELSTEYVPQQVNLAAGTFKAPCVAPLKDTRGLPPNVWPQSCNEVNGDAIYTALTSELNNGPRVGFMLLNGKRLGNLGAMEAIPSKAISGFRDDQIANLIRLKVDPTVARAIAGQIAWNVGTRGGVGRVFEGRVVVDQKLNCTTQTSLDYCWIGRFGWIGDRVSLEDQVANAAFIEMNMTSSENYGKLYPKGPVQGTFPIRYNRPNCGGANPVCGYTAQFTDGNGDLLESDINRMADYARWLGDPTRSEFEVSLTDVSDGEQIFRNLQCHTCHVIDKILITDVEDTMLPPVFRKRLKTHIYIDPQGKNPPVYPFLSYLGTDLLMHDMGYLSQVGIKTSGIRNGTTGEVSPDFQNFVQKIRTPALKGLRFNRFVTDSHNNTVTATPPNPACDFLLHDGRACDAIEAAFLHDGPEIKWLGVINGLNGLQAADLQKLRAFLYSL